MSALTPEQVGVTVCLSCKEHGSGTGHHRADIYGPCSVHLEVGPVVAALVAEAVDQARAEERERIVKSVEELLDDCDQFVDTLKKPNRVAVWGVRRTLAPFGGKPHRYPLPAERCAECDHPTTDHGLNWVLSDEQHCLVDGCTCLLSNDESAWGRDEAMDDQINQALWEDAVTDGEPWALGDGS